MKIYRVGGAVRDTLLGHAVKDNDWVVVGATPDDLLKQGFTQVGRDFPVFLHPTSKEEYALARTERKSGAGYTGFTVHAASDVTLEQDLQRRDLTINAMAEAPDGSVIDPFNGQADLQAGCLRHVSPAFVEDPLRVLRVARFAARFNFSVAAETQQLMQQIAASGELNSLVPERVWQEIERALGEPYPWRFVEVLRECGALAVLLPELDRLFGVPQPPAHHPEIDTGEHILLCLQQARRLTSEPAVLFAVLVHDLGKGLTPPAEWPHHYGHEKASVELIEAIGQRYRMPKEYLGLAKMVAQYHTHCHTLAQLKPKTIVKTLYALDAFRRPQRFMQYLLACEADARGRTGFTERAYPQAADFQAALTAAQTVKAHSLVQEGLTGPALGEALRRRQVHAVAEWRQTQPHNAP